MTTSVSPSQTRHRSSANDLALLDVTDMKWKLFGKNEHFAIVQEAVVKIQAFVRGSLSRGKTSDMIQELIDGILSYQEIVAKYAAEDEERVRKQQLGLERKGEGKNVKGTDENGRGTFDYQVEGKRSSIERRPWSCDYVPSGSSIELKLKERLNILESTTVKGQRPWIRKAHTTPYHKPAEDTIGEGIIEAEDLNTSQATRVEQMKVSWSPQSLPQKLESTEHYTDAPIDMVEFILPSNDLQEQVNKLDLEDDLDQVDQTNVDDAVQAVSFPEIYLQESVAQEPGGKGYHRYRSSASGRNKRRPWRDDTNVFDAF